MEIAAKELMATHVLFREAVGEDHFNDIFARNLLQPTALFVKRCLGTAELNSFSEQKVSELMIHAVIIAATIVGEKLLQKFAASAISPPYC